MARPLIKITNETLVNRFFSLVDEKKSTEKCWNWQGYKTPNGYGWLRMGRTSRFLELAHRFSYRMHYGHDIPEKLCVCHKCDNRKCVNPFHFFLGTYKDNQQDSIRKGRRASLEACRANGQKIAANRKRNAEGQFI